MSRILVGTLFVLVVQISSVAFAQAKLVHDGAIVLTVNRGAVPIDDEALRGAIERRLGMAVRFSDQLAAAETRRWITLDFDDAFQVRVHCRDASGREIFASMELPSAESKLPETVARFVRDLSPEVRPCINRARESRPSPKP